MFIFCQIFRVSLNVEIMDVNSVVLTAVILSLMQIYKKKPSV